MFSFFKNDKPPYSVQKISEGRFLDKAKEVKVSFFFKCWMAKKPRKAMVGSWFIVHTDDKYVYWGWPVFKRLFSDNRVLEEFYKTNKQLLEEEFPNYKKRDGNAIRIRLHDIIRKDLDKASVTVGMNFKATLNATDISIESPCTITPFLTTNNPEPASEKATYHIVLDKESLELIKLERIT